MKVGIATVQVPFISGGAEIHARLLKEQLLLRGVEADIITTPFKWYPPKQILEHIKAVELLDLTEVSGQKIDRLITLKFPMYFTRHDNKVGWILHQHRQAYELFGGAHSDLHISREGRRVCKKIHALDSRKLPEHQRLYTNSQNVANRLKKYNGIDAQALYHPPEDYQRLHCASYQPYILVPGRADDMKRQLLMVEALRQLPGLSLVIIGNCDTPYGEVLKKKILEWDLVKRVDIKGHVSREEKTQLYANALAVYNGAYEEDYGYITLEAFFASKLVITHSDSGGPLEFVIDAENGFITEPSATAIVQALKGIDAQRAEQLGQAGHRAIAALNLNWDHIIGRLLA